MEDIVYWNRDPNVWVPSMHRDISNFGMVKNRQFAHTFWLTLTDSLPEKGGSMHMCTIEVGRKLCPGLNQTLAEGKPDCRACECANVTEAEPLCPALNLEAGDVVIFKPNCVHWTQDMKDPNFHRLSIIGRYVESRGAHLAFPPPLLNSTLQHAISVQNSCVHGLSPGDPLSGPCFPQVYPSLNLSELSAKRKYTCAVPCDQCATATFVGHQRS
eukprot:gnl/TRDRNA2_/TRDRNA2_175097_c0_seq1.p1 gnl/TRDRNA2_/TRDRNA2_175097_c0~~gnl/TRDRNA2_/TRDRNA2_175097_c0_seq1.p1  ORF type:complete len:234 (+),score=8.46 gnl/TRDRNA2_/TRDRNA2_175097_c0_seq1:63-704(+)